MQAEFYHWAKLIGLRSILELVTPVGRLDIAVISQDATRLLCIVECKSPKRDYPMSETAQIRRYKSIGVPVYGLWRMERAKPLAETILSHNYQGKPIAEVMAMPRKTRRRRYRYRPENHLNIKSDRAW